MTDLAPIMADRDRTTVVHDITELPEGEGWVRQERAADTLNVPALNSTLITAAGKTTQGQVFPAFRFVGNNG
ncbi:MAG: hypothetical protein TR69_WS6001000161 [candidate division WS6 bacterium OLB20]|uniref:Uncharacterized protein n=1 Tax=candidate division WS6 bacterium OLB20 TaxID=1617426 RepID=A0A136M070_9BACT|nr:MAG: hypothetical protein TR69_WS6001000161 [candidate division WS6 bacterium OLB20]